MLVPILRTSSIGSCPKGAVRDRRWNRLRSSSLTSNARIARFPLGTILHCPGSPCGNVPSPLRRVVVALKFVREPSPSRIRVTTARAGLWLLFVVSFIIRDLRCSGSFALVIHSRSCHRRFLALLIPTHTRLPNLMTTDYKANDGTDL